MCNFEYLFSIHDKDYQINFFRNFWAIEWNQQIEEIDNGYHDIDDNRP